jgi:hypothetical protein
VRENACVKNLLEFTPAVMSTMQKQAVAKDDRKYEPDPTVHPNRVVELRYPYPLEERLPRSAIGCGAVSPSPPSPPSPRWAVAWIWAPKADIAAVAPGSR